MSVQVLPEGWALANYADVYLSASNGTGGTQNKEGVGIPVSRIETIANETIDYSRIGYLAEYDETKVEKHKLIAGDILFSHINSPIHLGKTAIYDDTLPLYHGINLLRIVVDRSVVSPNFFNAHCRYIRALGLFSLNAQHAVNQSSLNQKKLGSFELPLPPLAEQQVIADKLDTLLAQVENIKARLEHIPEILKQFRQSVLVAAVSGKLTEEWRNTQVDNLTWKETTLGRVILEGPQNGLYKPSSCYGSGVRIVRIDGFYDGELLDWDTLKQVEVDDSEFQKWSLQPNDILVNRVNSIEYLGKSALVRNVPEPTVFESNIMRFSLNLDIANPEFISLFLCSSIGLEQLRKNAKLAVNQASINQGDVKSCLLNLPIINEQIEIVRRVKELFAYLNLLEQQVQSASDQVNYLTQSILAKAFRGELTAEWREANSELISGENSAEALLGRIKVERELAKPATKRGRGKS